MQALGSWAEQSGNLALGSRTWAEVPGGPENPDVQAEPFTGDASSMGTCESER